MEDKKPGFGKIRWDGVITILLGLFLLIFPNASVKIVCILIGVALVIMGIMLIISYIQEHNRAPVTSNLFIGIGMVVLGILLFIFTNFFVSVILIIFGLILLYGCVMLFMQAYNMRHEKGKDFFLPLIMGIVILILGILMIINPVGTLSFIVQMVGVAMIIEGISLLFFLKGFWPVR